MVLSATSNTVKRFSARIRYLRLKRPDHRSFRSDSSLLSETVSDAIERIDRVKGGIDGTELAPDALNVTVDGAIVDIDIVAIGYVEQLVTGFYNAGPLRERFEDQKLGDGQADEEAVPQH